MRYDTNCTVLIAYKAKNSLKVYSWLEVILVSILLFGSLVSWFYAKDYKKLIYLQSRNSASIVLFALATLSLLFYAPAAKLPNDYSLFVSCAVANTTYLAFPALFLAGLIVEVLSFGFKAELRIQLAKAGKQQERISKWRWYTDKPGFSNVLAILLGSLAIAVALAACTVTCPEFGSARCKIIEASDYKTQIYFFLLALLALAQMIYIYRRLLTFPDPFNILIEVRRVTFFTFFAMLVKIVLNLVFGDEYETSESIDFSPFTLVSIPFYAILIYMVPYQVYKAFNFTTTTREQFRQFDLKRVMNDEAGRALLKQYLIYEFSVENMLFLEAVEQIKDLTDEVPRIVHMRMIYDEFIINRRLNLSSGVYRRLDLVFKGNDAASIKAGAFNSASTEIFNLIEFDAFQRFKNSKSFKIYVGVLRTEASL